MSSSQIPFSHRNNTGRISSSNSSSASSSSHRGGLFNNHAHWGTSNAPADLDQPFNREMRDRQARGKDPYPAGDDMDDGSDASPGRIGGHHQSRNSNSGGRHHQQQPKEPFSKVERRDWAETVLDNPELLMMYAQSSGDTLPATRYKFKKIMCGFEEDEEDDEDSIPDTRGGGNYQQQQQQFQAQQRSSSSVQQQRGRGDRPHSGRR